MAEESPQEILDAAQPQRIADAFRRISLGSVLAQMSAPRRRTTATTPALTVAVSTVTFPRPVIHVVAGSASVGGNDRPVSVIPEGSAATAQAGGATGVHSAVATRDTSGRITALTFSAAPTVPFFDVIEDETGLATELVADLS